MSGCVLVMAKSPVPGRVKTRLCPPCSPIEAAEIARAALIDTLAAVSASAATRRLVALHGEPGSWLPDGFEVVAQQGTTFQDRLEHAWSLVDGPCVQIGMDTPQVTPAHLDDGLAALDRSPAALGLAADGGWWALALRRPQPGLFTGVPMSTPHTGLDQRRRLLALGLSVADLPELADIDTVTDLVRVAGTAPNTKTARVAAELGLLTAVDA